MGLPDTGSSSASCSTVTAVVGIAVVDIAEVVVITEVVVIVVVDIAEVVVIAVVR